MKTTEEIKAKLELGRKRLAQIQNDDPANISGEWKVRAQIEALEWVLEESE